MTSENKPLEIDLDKILRSRASKLRRWLPGWLVRWFERLIRQREINAVLRKHGHLEGTAFIRAVLDEWDYRPQVASEDAIDPAKKYIFASNHPLGGLDGLILAAEIEKRWGPVRVMVNDLLMNITPIRSIFVPVNLYGRQSAQYARELDAMYASDVQVLLFPAGLCSRHIDGRVQDLPWKKNVIVKAVQYERDIVPVFFGAVNTPRFYRMANLRKRLGIKPNIELVLLPGEMFRQKNRRMAIFFGPPIPWQTFSDEKRSDEWAAWLRERVYSLPLTSS